MNTSLNPVGNIGKKDVTINTSKSEKKNMHNQEFELTALQL